MRIMVTGAAGFIGSHVVEQLSAAGHSVLALDCLLPESYDAAIKRARLESVATLPGVTTVVSDLRSDPLEGLLDGIDAVINQAAMPGLMKSWAEFDLYAACNLLAVDRLVQACTRARISRFVHISTSSVYGRIAIGDEEGQTEPFSPYGVSKLAAEKLLLAHFMNFGFPAVVLRYFSVYGPGQRPDMAYHRFCEALLDGRPLTIYGDGQQSRSNTYVADAAAASIAAVTGGREGQVYNIAGGDSICLLDAVRTLGEAAGVKPLITHAPARPGDQRDTKGDSAKARAELGWSPSTPVEVGLGNQMRWHESLRG